MGLWWKTVRRVASTETFPPANNSVRSSFPRVVVVGVVVAAIVVVFAAAAAIVVADAELGLNAFALGLSA